MYEPVSGQNSTQNPGEHPTFSSVPSWKDLIESAVLQNQSSEVDRLSVPLEHLEEPPAPGSGCAGQNVRALLEDDLLADAVQHILNTDYCSADRDLDLVLQLNHESNDAKFLINTVAKRKRILSFCTKVQSIANSIRSSIARGFAQGVNSLRSARKDSDG